MMNGEYNFKKIIANLIQKIKNFKPDLTDGDKIEILLFVINYIENIYYFLNNNKESDEIHNSRKAIYQIRKLILHCKEEQEAGNLGDNFSKILSRIEAFNQSYIVNIEDSYIDPLIKSDDKINKYNKVFYKLFFDVFEKLEEDRKKQIMQLIGNYINQQDVDTNILCIIKSLYFLKKDINFNGNNLVEFNFNVCSDSFLSSVNNLLTKDEIESLDFLYKKTKSHNQIKFSQRESPLKAKKGYENYYYYNRNNNNGNAKFRPYFVEELDGVTIKSPFGEDKRKSGVRFIDNNIGNDKQDNNDRITECLERIHDTLYNSNKGEGGNFIFEKEDLVLIINFAYKFGGFVTHSNKEIKEYFKNNKKEVTDEYVREVRKFSARFQKKSHQNQLLSPQDLKNNVGFRLKRILDLVGADKCEEFLDYALLDASNIDDRRKIKKYFKNTLYKEISDAKNHTCHSHQTDNSDIESSSDDDPIKTPAIPNKISDRDDLITPYYYIMGEEEEEGNAVATKLSSSARRGLRFK
jgi:hypothetical protein